MSVTLKHIGLSLCFIPEYIRKKNSIVKNDSKFGLKLNNLSFIILIAFIYLIHDFAFIFSDRYIVEKDNEKQLKLKGNFFMLLCSCFLCRFSYIRKIIININIFLLY